MCGIGAILKVYEPGETVPEHRVSIPERWLDVLDDSVERRGPDGAGRFRDRAYRDDGCVVDVALVHRRLSIIDHAGGAQPMAHVRYAGGDGELLRPDRMVRDPIGGRPEGIAIYDAFQHARDEARRDLVCAAFNGCIYNHRKVRAELEAAGHRFVSDHSDTEVLVHGWRACGTVIQDKLDGMYATLVWSRRDGQLGWGRDLVGEKPLYSRDITIDSVVTEAFASTPSALARWAATVGGTLDDPWDAIPDWIQTGAAEIPAFRSWNLGRAMWRVCPAMPRRGTERPRTSHTRKQYANQSALRGMEVGERGTWHGYEAKPEMLVDDLRTSVRSRLEADVPMGAFLSGGLDSGLLSAFAVQELGELKTFTVRMPQGTLDESVAAEETARAIGTEHTTLDCEARPAEDLLGLIESLGLPFGDSSLLPTLWVSRAAQREIRVALAGDGGDELFGGYRRYSVTPLMNRWRGVMRLLPSRLLSTKSPSSGSTMLYRLIHACRGLGYAELVSIFPMTDLRSLLQAEGQPDYFKHYRFNSTHDALRSDFEDYLPNDLLRKSDTASMSVGLEVRSPMLAKGVVDRALKTRLATLMPRGERKGLLRAAARLVLPDHIVDRPKQGFAIPVGEWFRTDYGGMRTLMLDHLRSADPFPGLGDAGVEIDLGFVERLIAEHDAAGERSLNPWRGRDHSQRLYMLVVMSIWSKWLDRVRSGDGPRAAAVDPFAVV